MESGNMGKEGKTNATTTMMMMRKGNLSKSPERRTSKSGMKKNKG